VVTVKALMDRLSELSPDAEVRIATQPSYPIAHAVVNVVGSADLGGGSAVAWIAAEQHEAAYAPRAAWGC
jgi:hypothetical protein